MSIKTINNLYTGEYKNLNSKFLGYLYPFSDKRELNEILHKLKKEHPKACHWCYAYRWGYENEEVRANDDGEPSGTAGKPILNQLYSFEVQNCLLVVVRYFGGTKLGVSGLIEAYKETAKSTLMSANIIIQEEMVQMNLCLDLEQYHKTISSLKKEGAKIIDETFLNNQYQLTIIIPKNIANNYSKLLNDNIL